jgi:putative phage-type endonuclease
MSAEQGSYEWLLERCGYLTASMFSDILPGARGAYSDRRKTLLHRLVAERLTGMPTVTYQNDAMRWGNELEPVARSEFETRMGIEVRECGFVKHPSIPLLGASPDGICADGYLLEIKCPTSATHVEWLAGGTIPEKHKPQMWLQMVCAQADACHFVHYDPRMPEAAQFSSKCYGYESRPDWETEIDKFLDEAEQLEQKIREL